MPEMSGVRSTLSLLWFRLITLGIVGFVFAEALLLAPGKAQGWSYYLSRSEVLFEVAVRLVFAALVGIALGSLVTAAIAPFVWRFEASRDRLLDWATKVSVVLVVFLDSRLALTTLIKWLHRGERFKPALLIAHAVVFLIALCIPRARREVLTSLDGFLSAGAARRIATATLGITVVLVGIQFALSRSASPVKAALVQQRPAQNFLLITFDALDAEDLSIYGRKLPTTPNIDRFASQGTVFTNFYSASTFTTPSVATMLTGTYPSESHVHQLQARVRGANRDRNLPRLLRAGGYATGAFLANPFAYYFARNLESDFDFLPEPVFQQGRMAQLWNATRWLHQDSGIGSRIDEYFDLENAWNLLANVPQNISMRMRPAATFDEARQVLAQMPDGFFLWIHVITPHNPYLPDSADRGRFLPPEKVTTFEEEFGGRWKPHYDSDQQPLLNERRLRYDEFIATADRAFGNFLADFDASERARNTTVIVSADHGESFEGGVYQHSSPYLTRPVIHVPLIIRLPGQQQSRTVTLSADQTSLAPTILELAAQTKPEWMPGQSLAPYLRDGVQSNGAGLAFTQYLERNSVFAPLRHGKVGVIDGQYQYVLDIATQKGELRPLDQAQVWNLDRTAENPARAEALRQAIYSRFPYLRRKPS
jgi:arylsulfatase A-like enzyme